MVLSKHDAILGRGNTADVMLSEEFISRQHARYEMLQAGPTIEAVSDKGLFINGKRFKPGKKVLLETGDAVGMGNVTELLFVAAGDDVDAAVSVHTQSRGLSGGAFGRKGAAQPPVEELPPVEPPPEPKKDEFAKAPQAMDMSPAERAAIERKAKNKKRAIILGIYLGCIGLLFILLMSYRGRTKEPPAIPELADEEITRCVEKTPDGYVPSPMDRDRCIEDALSAYNPSGPDVQHLYKCVDAFRKARAYSDTIYLNYPKDPKVDEKCRRVMAQLSDEIKKNYHEAIQLERNRDWGLAQDRFYYIRSVLYPEVGSAISTNVQDHFIRCKQMRMAGQSDRRSTF